MKLLFKTTTDDDLELLLASARYSQFWEANEDKILKSFQKHTGLKFKQKAISVHIRKDGHSKAGNIHSPMELSMQCRETDSVGCTLIHELAHRLVIGNGIEPPEGSDFTERRANYLMHRHIYLFLHDVYVDVMGKKVADNEVKRESDEPNSFYTKAWKWALSKDYKARQASFKELKKLYIKSQ